MHPKVAYAQARRGVRRAVNPHVDRRNTTAYQDQAVAVNDYLHGGEKRWLFWFDGGRAGWFQSLYPEYLSGEYRNLWNGGLAYSGDWAKRTLGGEYPGKGLFSSMPVRELQRSDYDGRDHFDVAPDIDTENTVNERLAALGYREEISDGHIDISPGHVNQAVREHMDELDGGVIRYLKPHPPLDGLEELTSGGDKITNMWRALVSGDLSRAELLAAYERTYRQAFEAAMELIPDLDGQVAITADHGECLGDCGQLLHGPYHTPHDHLTTVPFLRVRD